MTDVDRSASARRASACSRSSSPSIRRATRPPRSRTTSRISSDRLVGLTGTKEEIAAAAKAYRVYYKIHGDPASNPNYAVDHSGFIYPMGRDGKFLTHFMHDTPPDRVADAIRRYL